MLLNDFTAAFKNFPLHVCQSSALVHRRSPAVAKST